jgi:transposase
MTRRLTWLLQIIGLATGGELGTRLADRFGIATTPPTLLRHVMKYPSRKAQPVRVLGVDDWSWKKGRRYGTLLIDLERHKIIDVLEDRERSTFEAWLLEHPEVEFISRDRATQYAAAARKAAPQARQIADRFHLVRNLADALERLLARCHKEMFQDDQGVQSGDEPPPAEVPMPLPSPQVWQQHPAGRAERAYEAHRIEREDRYRQIAVLHAQGLQQAEIAKLLGISTYQVRTWLKRGSAPIHRRPAGHRSLFDPYAAYVLDRWKAGVHDGKQLYEEIQKRGFRGSKRLVQNFLQTLRGSDRQPRFPIPPVVPPQPGEQFSAHNAVWLFIRDQAKFTDAEKETLAFIRQRSTTAETAYGLVQDFLTMARKREGRRLDAWINAVLESGIPELNSFVCGILKDKDAVLAGLTLVYSNGPVEAQVGKLKLVKRSMFGRAKLPLLRQRLRNKI